jgi:hypothetical protein
MTTPTDAFVDAIASRVAELLLPQLQKQLQLPPAPAKAKSQLWTVTDIANYSQFSAPHVRRKIMHHHRFPAPANPNARTKRWPSESVKRFFKDYT